MVRFILLWGPLSLTRPVGETPTLLLGSRFPGGCSVGPFLDPVSEDPSSVVAPLHDSVLTVLSRSHFLGVPTSGLSPAESVSSLDPDSPDVVHKTPNRIHAPLQ